MSDFIRNLAWRLGRKGYCWARGDLPNDPNHNGEYWVLGHLIRGSVGVPVLFDVGANKGDWSLRALSFAKESQKRVDLFAFEPSSQTRQILESRLITGSNVHVFGCARANKEGEADFYSDGVGSGTNSLNAIYDQTIETVRMRTFDAFLNDQSVDRVAMLKIDTEGFDFSVLQGASEALSRGRIDLVQFEYNWRWLLNNASLRDVFQLIEGKPYSLGKLVCESIVLFDKWHLEPDRFFENNYVLVRKDVAIERSGRTMRFNESNIAVDAA